MPRETRKDSWEIFYCTLGITLGVSVLVGGLTRFVELVLWFSRHVRLVVVS